MGSDRIILHKSENLDASEKTTIKCVHCFSAQVTRVCHHCGAYLCDECEPFVIRWLRHFKLLKYLFKDKEFFGLYEFRRSFQLSAHCKKHVHYGESIYHLLIWLLFICFVAATTVLWLWGNYVPATGVGLVGLITTIALFASQGWVYHLLFGDPSRPYLILPAIYTLSVKEAIEADFQVDSKMKNYLNFNTASEDIESKLSVTVFPLPDYFNRQNRAIKASRGTVAISAGYLSLYNLKKVKFKPDESVIKFRDQIVGSELAQVDSRGQLPLSGTLPVDVFKQIYQDQATITFEHPYTILEKAGWVGTETDLEFPFWIVADLSLARRRLTIFIYVTPEISKKFSMELLSIKLPPEIAKDGVEIHGRLHTTTDTIFWANFPLNDRINKFNIDFRNPLPPGIELTGEYKLSIDDFLLSGLAIEKHGHLWFANGEPVSKQKTLKSDDLWLEKFEKKTTFTGTFQFDTSVFKVQREYTASYEGDQRHCRPDHELVAKIAEILTDQNVEIKSIVETPARIGDFRDGARLWDHYWEIKSRYYLEAELQYVEVHVVVYGQENLAILFKQASVGEPIKVETANAHVTTGNSIVRDEEYKDEYVKWQLHLRSEVSVHNQDLADRLDQLCEKLGEKINKTVTQLAVPDKYQN